VLLAPRGFRPAGPGVDGLRTPSWPWRRLLPEVVGEAGVLADPHSGALARALRDSGRPGARSGALQGREGSAPPVHLERAARETRRKSYEAALAGACLEVEESG